MMKGLPLILLFVISSIIIVHPHSAKINQKAPSVQAGKNQAYAFVNVNVVPMDQEQILRNQTVIIRDGRIIEIGLAAKTKVPKDAFQIDGRNKYLLPGLADMHIHSFSDDSDLLLYIANGVTTVRNMAGSARHLKLREQLAKGEILGPTYYTCGTYLMGFNNAEASKRIVDEQSRSGYDCVKIYNMLDWTQDAYDAALDAAQKNKVPAVGYLPRNLPIEATLKTGRQTVEHTEEFLYPYFFKLNK